MTSDEHLLEELKDPEFALLYLNECLKSVQGETPEMTRKIFLNTLRMVIKAQGMSRISRLSRLNRSNLYSQIGEEGKPGFDTILSILDCIGVQIELVPKKKSA